MALTKEVVIDKAEVMPLQFNILQVIIATLIKEEGAVISSSNHRITLVPGDDPHKNITMPDGSVVNFGNQLEPYCKLLHTPEVVQAYQDISET
jgi:hypothetical protein